MRMSGVFRYSLITLAALAIAGCSDGTNPAAPGTRMMLAPDHMPQHTQTLATGMIVKRTITITSDLSTTATITPKGGWMEIPDAGLILYFPPNAVSSDLEVTATAHNGNKVVYSFEPHGTQFNTPIYVAQLLRYTELNTPRNKNRAKPWAGYLADGLVDIAPDGTGYFAEVFSAQYYGKGNDTYAIFTTTHFSGYALASGRSGNGRE